MKKYFSIINLFFVVTFLFAAVGCKNTANKDGNTENQSDTIMKDVSVNQQELDKYISCDLKADLSHLSENQKEMLPLLFEVAEIMDDIHWQLACGEKQDLLGSMEDEATKNLFIINYGPWNRLDGLKSFVEGVEEKPKGAYFYPTDMTKEEFETFESDTKSDLYTVIRRNEAGKLVSVPYHEEFNEELQKAADLLNKASELADDAGFKKYLKLRAVALMSGDYFESDMAWMEMKDNDIEFVVGPIENYEDALFGYKAAFEAFILIKDKSWSDRLAKYSALLPKLQTILPVEDKYKKETPGANSDLGAYDAIFYAGDCNAGSKTIAINLPNDEKVQLAKGSRRLQLKNSMRAKFDNILIPISNILIAEDLRKNVTFDAFFANTMFHEVAHGLGIKNTITGKGSCRKSLTDLYSTLEEGKADVLGLWLITNITEMGEFETELMDNYVTFITSIFRSIRFGTSSSHAKANLIRYNFFMEEGAMTRNEDGTYSVDFDKVKIASDKLANIIITIQGDGDYEAATKLKEKYHVITPDLEKDLQRLDDANIPVDVIWNQGLDVCGLK